MFKNKFIIGILLIAALGGIVWLGLSVGRNGALKQANILVGGGTWNTFDDSTMACQSKESALIVTGGSGAYDWMVSHNDANGNLDIIFQEGIISSGSARSNNLGFLDNVGGTVTFTAPSSFMGSRDFQVSVVEHGAEWDGAVTFDITVAPPCVTKLEFVNPDPNNTITPNAQNNIIIKKIRATFSDGSIEDYQGDVINELPVQIQATPATGVRLENTADGKKITLPAAHGEITIHMAASGNQVSPTYVNLASVALTDGRYTLSSGQANENSLEVYNASGDWVTDYQFHDETTPANDYLTWTGTGTAPATLTIGYSYPSATVINAVQPLTIAGNSCEGLKASIVQGSGQGFDLEGPEPFQSTIVPGEVRTIYSQGGTSGTSGVKYAWKSSDSDIIEVKALTDQSSGRTPLNNSNVSLSANLLNPDDAHFTIVTQATAKNCQSTTTGTAPTQVTTLNSCDVDVSALVTYNFQGEEYPVTITTPTGPLADKTVTGRGVLSGTITGATSRISKASGGTIRATGTLTGNVGGDAIGGVIANVTIVYSIAADQLLEGDMSSRTKVITKTGALTKGDTLIPTDIDPRSQGDAVVTDFAVLKAKAEGKATILVTDQATGCTAPLDIEVKGEKITVEKVAQTSGDIIEVGDSLQVKALRGFRHTTNPVADDRTDITNNVTWTSDNTQVATVSNTGRVTAVAPGTANITAAYTRQGQGSSTPVVSEGRVTIRVNAITDLNLTLDPTAIAQLSQDQKAEINKTIALAINSISVVGKTLTIQGHTFTMSEPSRIFFNKVDHIKAIRDALVFDINAVKKSATSIGVVAVAHPSLVGVIVLNKNDHTALSVSATADSQDLTIQPQVSQTVTLDRTLTYPAQLLAEYDNGLTKRFTARSVTWVNTPINTLHDASLQGGLFKAGEIRGTSRVHVKIENNGSGHEVVSNDLTFEVSNKPFVEYAQIVGNSTVVRGATLNLAIKVTDADTIGDLQNIEVLLAKLGSTTPAPTTFDTIIADSNTRIFNIQTFLDQVTVEPQTPPAPPPPADNKSGLIPAAYAEDAGTVAKPFSKIFTLPIKIPELVDVTDGTYKLLIQITDKSGQSVKFVRSIQIGVAAGGDVNGDGRLNINDAIMAFRFFTRAAQPTANQLAAIDLDHNGRIDLTEVIALLRKIL